MSQVRGPLTDVRSGLVGDSLTRLTASQPSSPSHRCQSTAAARRQNDPSSVAPLHIETVRFVDILLFCPPPLVYRNLPLFKLHLHPQTRPHPNPSICSSSRLIPIALVRGVRLSPSLIILTQLWPPLSRMPRAFPSSILSLPITFSFFGSSTYSSRPIFRPGQLVESVEARRSGQRRRKEGMPVY